MKKILPEYYPLEKDEYKKLWTEGIFIFDANTLLNLYRYSFDTVENLLNIFKKIKDRLWLPYQIASEYHENRLSTILEEEEKYKKIINDIKNSPIKILKDIDNNLEEYNSRFEKDDILEELNNLYKGKVGEQYKNEEREKYIKIAEERFKNGLVPGLRDKDKTINKRYGDVIIWLNTIEKSKEEKNLVFLLLMI